MPEEYRQKNNTVYRRMKADILGMKFKPGEKISEEWVASRYGTSRSPAHDALKRLKHEGLIVVEPQVGTFIAEISIDQLYRVLQARIALEPLVVEWATPNISASDLTPIREKLEKLKLQDPESRVAEQQETDRELHFLLADRCGNEYIAAFLKEMTMRMCMMELYTTFPDVRRMVAALDETQGVLAAVGRGDPKKASLAMLHHLENISEAFRKSVDAVKGNTA
jgi:DNA-binding GntR family transcriptional regulator